MMSPEKSKKENRTFAWYAINWMFSMFLGIALFGGILIISVIMTFFTDAEVSAGSETVVLLPEKIAYMLIGIAGLVAGIWGGIFLHRQKKAEALKPDRNEDLQHTESVRNKTHQQ